KPCANSDASGAATAHRVGGSAGISKRPIDTWKHSLCFHGRNTCASMIAPRGPTASWKIAFAATCEASLSCGISSTFRKSPGNWGRQARTPVPHCCVAANRKWRTLQEAASLRSRLCIAVRRLENLRELRRFCGAVIQHRIKSLRVEWASRALTFWKIDVLPTEEPRIDGPGAGSGHRQGCRQDHLGYGRPKIAGMRGVPLDSDPHFRHGCQRSCHRGTKTDQKK